MTARYLYNNVYALLASCLLLCLAACSGESAEGGPDAPGQPVTLRLQIGAAAGTNALPQTKAGDNLAKQGEYISTLKVFITDASGQVEKVVPFMFTAEQEEALKTGDLESCTSEAFTITTGAKTIYAFANYEGILELEEITIGQTLSLPSTITWNKGADWKPGTDNSFIPMSAWKEVTVSKDTQELSVELVRLLSRLDVSFKNGMQSEISLSAWNIGNFSKQINLFGGGAIQPAGEENSYTIDGGEKAIPTGDEPTDGGYYYVSESAMTDGFSVSITRNGHAETKNTVRKELPRNSVWPVEILFSDYTLNIHIEGMNPPIGGYPDGMTTDWTGSTECTIRGGGPFTLTPTLIKNGAKMNGVTWEANPLSESKLVQDLKVSADGKTITGVMKVPENTADIYTFTLKASQDGKELASFSVTLKYEDIFE